jgi:hypothetical protein
MQTEVEMWRKIDGLVLKGWRLHVSRGYFTAKPRVHSAVVALTPAGASSN